MNIFLADLQNSYYRYIRNSVPIGMGYVASFLHKRFGKGVRLSLFRKFEEVYEALQTTRPDLVAFGSYSWNTELTLKTAQYIRERFPATLIAAGGPDISQNLAITNRDALAYRQIDFFMPNEGEEPTANIAEALFAHGNPREVRCTTIAGCISVNPETGKPWGVPIARYEGDINDIPSPYFDGFLDRFLDDQDYLPIVQTSRGCPYRCTFCVSGKDTWSKVKAFELDRVKAEIDYVEKKAKNRYLRFADENFGILHRDVEIAEYLIEKKNKSAFPHAVSIYTDKHPTDRVKHISLLLRDLMPFNISYQSATHDVLRNIKRINLKDNAVNDAVAYARQNDLTLVSELIFALPGETTSSFLESIDKLIDLRFESIAINQLRILKGSEMDHPDDRERFRVRTMFAMSENGYTNHAEIENIEVDEWVVANSTLDEADYFKINRFICIFDFAHYRSYLKELLFFFECHGVRASKLLMRVIEDPVSYPLLAGQGEKFERSMRAFLHETPEAAVSYVRAKMIAREEIAGIYRLKDNLGLEILMNGSLRAAIDEVARAGTALYREAYGELPDGFMEELDFVCQLVFHAFIPLDQSVPHEITIESLFDIAAWIAGNYRYPLSSYRLAAPRPLGLKIRGPEIYESIWAMNEPDLVKYKRAFAIINSANRRRALVPASVLAEAS